MTNQHESPKYSTSVLSGPAANILGVNWSDILASTHLRTPDPSGNYRMVYADDFCRLWSALVQKSGQPDVSRFLGQRLANGPTIPVHFALSTAPDLATGLARFARFKTLFGPLRLSVTETANRFGVRVLPDDPSVPVPPTASVMQIVFLHLRAQSLAMRPFAPVAVSMPLSHTERESFVDIFGMVPTEGDAALHYRRDDARIGFISENTELWRATEADLIAMTRIANGQTTFAERVRSCFVEAFAISEPTIAYVCDRLHVSRTTLLRKLRAEGTSFQQLLEETRKTLAMRYLTKSELTNQQIAHLVGYVDPNAFQRAFKRWTGTTPQSIRQTRERRP
jgi:AraC-like DNA-binding protein